MHILLPFKKKILDETTKYHNLPISPWSRIFTRNSLNKKVLSLKGIVVPSLLLTPKIYFFLLFSLALSSLDMCMKLIIITRYIMTLKFLLS